MGFNEKVYKIVMQIPFGRVATYGQIALLAGSPRACRAVGSAMSKNPYGIAVPCHRVVNHSGTPVIGAVFSGGKSQQNLLEAEGVVLKPNGKVDLKKYQWSGSKF